MTDYSWDGNSGNVLTETRAAPTTGATRPQKRYTYVQAYAWYKNAAGTLVQSAYPVWLLSQTSECRTGSAPTCIGTADETRTTLAYGAPGTANNLLPTALTVAAGDGSLSATTAWTYDAFGNKLTEDGPLPGAGDTTRWRYDALRRIVGVIGPDPDGAGPRLLKATRNTYDSAGRLVKVELGTVNSQSDADWALFSPLQTTETAYDALDRKVKDWSYGTTGGTQRVTQFSYDLAGHLECTAVRMNPAAFGSLPASACTLGAAGSDGPDRITKLTYDAAGQVLKTTVAYGTTDQTDQETNSYTLNGKLATVTDGENNRTTFEYDGHDRLLKTRYPVPTQGALSSSTTDYEQLTYDANSNVTQRRLRDGGTIAFAFDNLNRITSRTENGSLSRVYGYDLLGHQTSATWANGGSPESFSYDAFGRLIQRIEPYTTLSYQYDAAGNRTRLTWPDGLFIQYDYDNVGLVSFIRENGAISGVGVLATFAYDNLGRRIGMSRGNGINSAFAYDPFGRLASMTHDPAGSSYDVSWTFGYNPAGQLSSTIRNNDAYSWTGHYNVNRGYTVNGLNQTATAGATGFNYDGRGNLTQSGSTTYGYDAMNHLTGSNVGTGYVEYGALDELQGMGSTPGSNTRFASDGGNIIGEYIWGVASVQQRYVYAPGVDEPIVWYEGAGTANRRWLLADERGSIISVTDASGATLAINRYDEYGIPQSGNAGRFQYTGQAWIPELGMYYYKARMYSPTLGRFMQTDPVGYKDGINWYAYVANDPLNHTDPTGLNCYLCIREVVHNADGTVTIRSNEIMRALIPGQVAWDNATTAWANGDKQGAAISAAASAAEIVASVATAGVASRGTAAARAATATARGEQALQTTAHGAERIAGAGATRGGVLSAEGVQATRASGQTMTQADGASVFVAQGSNGRFNVVVQNEAGRVITTFENISQKSLDRLSRNYGWRP